MSEGFFTKKETASKSRPDGKLHTCAACGLYRNCKSPRIEPYGNFRKKILNIGEAPGCITGDSLIDTAFRDKSKYPDGIPIKDLVDKKNIYVYSFNTTSNKLVIGKVHKVWKTGRKKVYEVVYEWSYAEGKERITLQNSIKVTSNHLFLLKKNIPHDPFRGVRDDRKYVSIDTGLKEGYSLQPFHRGIFYYGFVGTTSKSMVKEPRFLLEYKIGRKLVKTEQCHHHNEIKMDDSFKNLRLKSRSAHSSYYAIKNNPMNNPIHKTTHDKIMHSKKYKKKQSKIMTEYYNDPINHKAKVQSNRAHASQTSKIIKNMFKINPVYWYNYLMGRQRSCRWSDEEIKRRFFVRFPDIPFPPEVDNHKVVSVRYVGIEDVYDMEIEKYHNFAVNGIFVHNSEEDRNAKPWQGKTGKLLQRTYAKLGIDLFEDCLNINAVLCRPTDKEGNNRAPTNFEAECCRRSVLKVINEYKPKVIVLFGNVAIFSLIGHRWKKDLGGITKWRGWTIPDQDFKTWICPTFHPSYIERANTNPYKRDEDQHSVEETIWIQDLEQAIAIRKKPFPFYVEPKIEIIRDLSILTQKIKAGARIAFDYETTGLKPQGFGHRIVCCSIATSRNHVYVFMMPKTKEGKRPFKMILKNEGIRKVAQNIKFEDTWSAVRLHTEVQGWEWDTMQASHIFDNRPGISGLKFQVYVQFGIVDYASEVAPYLESTDLKNGNSLNRILELIKKPGGKQKLLKYCGYDSINEFRLAEDQISIVEEAQLPF
jgi:uracil-DNA glycosylase family 4